MNLSASDTALRLNSPPLKGRGRGWGLSAETLTKLKNRARTMRGSPTEPEKRLWRALSNSQLAGFKFRRQEVIGRCIVDFWCPAAGLAVEVDGDTHADPARDAQRDAYLAGLGARVLHLTNPDVMRNIEGVLAVISEALHQSPPLQGRGGSRAAAGGVGADQRSAAFVDIPHPNPSPEGEGLLAVEAQKLLAISLEGSVG
jgi:very-short-patch-repair endonuclease